jgi:hypothetical protein
VKGNISANEKGAIAGIGGKEEGDFIYTGFKANQHRTKITALQNRADCDTKIKIEMK